MTKLFLTLGSLFSLSTLAPILTNAEATPQIAEKNVAIETQTVHSRYANGLRLNVQVNLSSLGINNKNDLKQYSKITLTGFQVRFLNQLPILKGGEWNINTIAVGTANFFDRHRVNNNGLVYNGDIAGTIHVFNLPISNIYMMTIDYDITCWRGGWMGMIDYEEALATSGDTIKFS